MGQVEGKVAIVTGGASGIGAACATTLAREGGKVVVTDLDDAGGQAVVEKIGGADGEAFFLHQDVSIEESWPGVIEATNRRFGRLDIMMANAGIGILCKAVEMSLTDWRRQTAVNLDGVFLAVAPSSLCHPLPVSGDQQDWPAIAPQKGACVCSQKLSPWSVRQNAMESASIRFTPGSLTRR